MAAALPVPDLVLVLSAPPSVLSQRLEARLLATGKDYTLHAGFAECAERGAVAAVEGRERGDERVLEALLEAGANPCNEGGGTITTKSPLAMARYSEPGRGRAALLEVGADVEAKATSCMAPLLFMTAYCTAKRIGAVLKALLLEAGADVDTERADGVQLIYCAQYEEGGMKIGVYVME
jgi:hypothetical protein